jgi:hypothetical protein
MEAISLYLLRLDEAVRTLGKPTLDSDSDSNAMASVLGVVREQAQTTTRVVAELASLVRAADAADAPSRGADSRGADSPLGPRVDELLELVRGLEERLTRLPAASAERFAVTIGATTPSTFYRGMGGEDVVQYGGVFVATYAKLPRIGAQIIVEVELPAGVTFEAPCVVAWTKDDLGGDSPAGFGATFSHLPADVHDMIAQFCRRREPLLHD